MNKQRLFLFQIIRFKNLIKNEIEYLYTIDMANTIDYLEELKNEAIYILQETAAQFEKQLYCFLEGKILMY